MKLQVDRSAKRRVTVEDHARARTTAPEDAKALVSYKDGWHFEIRMRGKLVGESHRMFTFGGGLAEALKDMQGRQAA